MKQRLIEQVSVEFAELKRVLFKHVSTKIEPVVSKAQGELLFLVARHESLRVGDLAREMHISSSACTQLIDGLIAHNLLERKHDEKDRRIVHVMLSKHGHEQITRLKKEYLDGFADIMNKLSETDLRTLHELLKKINRNIEEEE